MTMITRILAISPTTLMISDDTCKPSGGTGSEDAGTDGPGTDGPGTDGAGTEGTGCSILPLMLLELAPLLTNAINDLNSQEL